MKRLAIVLLVLAGAGRASGQTLTILHSFTGDRNEGANPQAGLAQGGDGNFYGTTEFWGEWASGTVFRVSQGGNFTNLASFNGIDGFFVQTGLVRGSDGNFYGTPNGGGTNGMGCVIRFTPNGGLTNLHSFTGLDGSLPYGVPVQGSDGNLYGTTYYGGTSGGWGSGNGAVFRISLDGAFAKLYSFGSQPNDGAHPYGGLVQGSDSNFYGTSSVGGLSNNGTVFRISPSGSLTTIYSFSGSAGANPACGLVAGGDGDFYGTTWSGGASNDGTVFQVSPEGTLTTLHSFSGGDGANPAAALVRGSDGNFYGTTYYGGTSNNGTVFQISPSGSFSNLYLFDGNGEPGRFAGLVQGSDGSFYGVTVNGGTNGQGSVYRLSVPLNPPANEIAGFKLLSVFDSSYAAILIPSVAGETYRLQYSDSMNPTNWINTGEPVSSIGGSMTTFDLVEPMTPQRFYRFVITP